MSKVDLIDFQQKFNLSNNLITTINSLFEKLVDFGYISIFKKKKLIEKLYENIDEVYIGTQNPLDYKSGFYDANKKILYIKDEKDISSVYLRVLYALTTEDIESTTHTTGYMITRIRRDSYKLEHINFGINRAVISNLVCKLCNMLPTDIGILSTYKTYSHNFLGYTIEAANNIYAMEGKMLSELCFALNIDEQLLYTGLFSKQPYNYLENLLTKKNFSIESDFFSLLDDTSRNYTTYNKLSFLSRKLNNNYLEFKKHALDEDTSNLVQEKESILKQIKNVIVNLKIERENLRFDMEKNVDEEFEETIDTSLNETLTMLEEHIKENLVKMQDILCDKLIESSSFLSEYQYASKLKQFSGMLIVENEKLSKTITNCILHKLLPKDEITSVNLTVKIKYMLVQNILSENKYTNISKSFGFKIIPDLVDETNGVALALLNINGRFARLVQINDLNLPIEEMNTKPSFIPLDNFAYLLNSDYSNMYVGFLEKIYTALRFKYDIFKSLRLDDLYLFEYNQKKYLIASLNNTPYVMTVDVFQSNYDFKMLDISENYSLFGNSTIKLNKKDASLLPTVLKD